MTREKLCQLGRSKVNLTSPEEKIKPNQRLPRNRKIIPSLRLPRNKIKLYQHLPSIKTIPSQLLPRNKTIPSQHLPSIKTIPSLLLPRNKIKLYQHLPRNKTIPSLLLPRKNNKQKQTLLYHRMSFQRNATLPELYICFISATYTVNLASVKKQVIIYHNAKI